MTKLSQTAGRTALDLDGVQAVLSEDFKTFPCPVCSAADGLAIRANRVRGRVFIGNAIPIPGNGGLVQCGVCQALVRWCVGNP